MDDTPHAATARARLRTIKIAHTVIWALFAGCVVAIPVAAWFQHFRTAAALAAVVLIEVVILLANRFSCPLTAVAAKYTQDRQPNFDIYLPQWLARYNKLIFGTLYVAGVAFTLLLWWRSQ